MYGKFITLEGIDGAGKSTHLNWLGDFLSAHDINVKITREPGGTSLGERLRELLLHEPMHAETEALLMFAARREHIEQVILPNLQQGCWVISDRFTDASFAYQGGGRRLDLDKLRLLEEWVHPNLQPDLTLLFDVPAEIGEQRIKDIRVKDRFEQEKLDFFKNVRNEYLRRAGQFPQRIKIIDGSQGITAVQAKLEKLINELLHETT